MHRTCRRPAVVVLCEVDGAFAAMKQLRRWASSTLKYDVRFLVGCGGGWTNGIVVLIDRAQGSFGKFKRLAPRVLGFEVTHKADATTRAYAALHGFSTSGFAEQVREAKAWVMERGGGLVMGDFNHVPCKRWRTSGKAPASELRLMRGLCGAVCACCGAEHGAGGRVVGGDGSGKEGEGGGVGDSPACALSCALSCARR